MEPFRKETQMQTRINSLKLKGINEDDLYRQYIDGKKLYGERKDRSIKAIKLSVKYLTELVDHYLALW